MLKRGFLAKKQNESSALPELSFTKTISMPAQIWTRFGIDVVQYVYPHHPPPPDWYMGLIALNETHRTIPNGSHGFSPIIR